MSLFFRESGKGSNQLGLSGSSEQHTAIVQHKKKRVIAKKMTPNKSSPAMSTRSKVPSSPSSPAMGTRSKKKLDL
jgi:hypothetical protein